MVALSVHKPDHDGQSMVSESVEFHNDRQLSLQEPNCRALSLSPPSFSLNSYRHKEPICALFLTLFPRFLPSLASRRSDLRSCRDLAYDQTGSDRTRQVAAKYQRIAKLLRRDIQTGVLRAEERLPGEIELARNFDVSRSTIRQALSTLQEAGLIQTWSGAGSSSATTARSSTMSSAGRRRSQGRAFRPRRVFFVSRGSTTSAWRASSGFPPGLSCPRPRPQRRGRQAHFARAQPAAVAAGFRSGASPGAGRGIPAADPRIRSASARPAAAKRSSSSG